MIEVNYNEYKETIAENMKLIVENHDLKKEIERLKNRLEESQLAFLSVNEKNNKAIEYIENKQDLSKMFGNVVLSVDSQKEILDILKGVDKDED